MSRLVSIKTQNTLAPDDAISDRLERVAKYIPGEVIATYMCLNGIAAAESDHKMRLFYFGLIFVTCLVATPFYLGKFAKPGDAKTYHQVVSTVAFVLWAYTIGIGLFVETEIYLPILASILIGIFTLASAFLSPSEAS
jgi:hypothetical protein